VALFVHQNALRSIKKRKKTVKIIRLEAENFKRLKAVEINPDGSLVIVGGKNGAGKTSALDAIRAAIGGKKACPQEPVRKGAKKSQVVLETEELVVCRKFTKNGTSIEVKSKDGGVFPSPQALLNKLVGSLSFDPLEFSRMAPKERADVVRRLVGLDFANLDAKRAGLYAKRTEVNRDLKKAEAKLESLPKKKAPEKEVSVSELIKEAERMAEINRNNEDLRAKLAIAKNDYRETKRTIEELQADLANYEKRGRRLAALVKEAVDQNVEEIRRKIDLAEETNAACRAAKERANIEKEAGVLSCEAYRLTDEIEKLDQRKAGAIQGAEYPIDGLSVTDDGIELDGLPFEQASSAQQLRCSVAMGLALNPKLRVLLVQDGSLLDQDNLTAIAEMAADADAQVWIERVGDGDECTVVIEDGEICVSQETD
jgi:predicted  nucleic acid-binding Zn-ribbon protein